MHDQIYSLSTIGETRLRERSFATMREFLQHGAQRMAQGNSAQRMSAAGYAIPADGAPGLEEPVTATVSAVEASPGEFIARWVAECEHPLYRGRERGEEPCGRSLVVDPADPVFACPPSCAFAGSVAGGRWRRVAFPEDRELVEAVLLARHPADRHTLPGQTAADLVAENVEHGDPVP